MVWVPIERALHGWRRMRCRFGGLCLHRAGRRRGSTRYRLVGLVEERHGLLHGVNGEREGGRS